ncbi:alpha/beta fold hydrolase [Fusibacter bizertensis]
MSGVKYNSFTIGEGMPIVMIHGFQLDHRVMLGACEPLLKDKKFKRIYFDLPGMGLTKDYHQIKNADQMIKSIAQLIKPLVGNEKFLIAGMSYGGYLARGLRCHFEDQVKGMFLFVPVVKPLSEMRKLPVHRVLDEDKAYAATLLSSELEEIRALNAVINSYVIDRQRIEIDEALLLGDEEYMDEYQAKGYKASYNVDSNNASFDKPVVIMAGKQDSVVGFEDQYALSLQFPRSTYIAVDCAAHAMHIEQAALFNAVFNGWIGAFE